MTTSATSYNTNQSAPTVVATATPTLTGNHYLSVYDNSGTLLCSQTPGYGNTCGGPADVPQNSSRTFTAYVAYGPPPAIGPPTVGVRATSNTVTVNNLGYTGTVALSTASTVVDSGQLLITATASPAVPAPYTVSMYRTDTMQRLATCTSTCTASVAAPPAGGWFSVAAYVATDAPTSALPSHDVDASAVITIQSSSKGADDYASAFARVAASMTLDELCLAIAGRPQPRTLASGSPGVLGTACMNAVAAGESLPAVIRAVILAAGAAGSSYLAYTTLDSILVSKGAVDPEAPHQGPGPPGG